MPPLLVKNMTYDGHVIAVPVNIHGANYQFYSIKVFNARGPSGPVRLRLLEHHLSLFDPSTEARL